VPVLAIGLAGCALPRAPRVEVERVSEIMQLEPGKQVADVGAGDGRWSEALARGVGDGGQVYATEVKQERVEEIRRRAQKRKLENVTALRGDQEDTGLPEQCCDAILLRLVYHHFTDPPKMRESLRRALRREGFLVIIDFEPKEGLSTLPGVPDRGGHGIRPDDLVEEMASDGWEVVARFEDWEGGKDRFCLVFRPVLAKPGRVRG
jgi:ubiquinone/menaquinone biosynthesis C-methylase UbiE